MELGGGSLANLAKLRDFKSRRLSSYDRQGGNFDCVSIPSGETATQSTYPTCRALMLYICCLFATSHARKLPSWAQE